MRDVATCLTAAAWLAAVTPGCVLAAGPGGHRHDHHDEAVQPADLPPAPSGLQHSLEDEIRPSGPGRISWSTYWKLCWQPVAAAQYYEMRLLTSEGAPRTPRRIDATCHRVEAAAGENPVGDGLPKRELMLAMQAAQASIQVRAVLTDGGRTAWTAEQPLGLTAGKPGGSTRDGP